MWTSITNSFWWYIWSMGNWSWGSTQIELVGAPLFFMYFHSQPVFIHSSGLSLQFKFFYSFGNQGILVLTNYHELRPFKRDYHLIQFHLTCDVYAIRFTESPSFILMSFDIWSLSHKSYVACKMALFISWKLFDQLIHW